MTHILRRCIALMISVLALTACRQHYGANEYTETNAIPLSEQSIYNLQDTFYTQDNKPLQLSSLRGKPVVLSMIFTNCRFACPRMTNNMKTIEEKIDSTSPDKVHYVLISFDSELDTPERLKEFANQHGLGDNWILLHGSDEAVSKLSVVLDVKYEKLGTGAFEHSNKKILLDDAGVIAYSEEGLENHAENIINQINKLTQR